ncbi:MAG: FAD-dependent oxidoreductase [Alphaproteobacteria bacterium]
MTHRQDPTDKPAETTAALAQRPADIVIIGGGPVGLWTAVQIKKRRPDAHVRVYERYSAYQRSHILRLENFSMNVYAKKSGDDAEAQFLREVLGEKLANSFKAAAGTGTVFIRTNDLEHALKEHARTLGIETVLRRIDSPQQAMDENPACKTFIAADGAHSKMRMALLGEDAVTDYPMQYVVEIKYQAEGRAGTLDFLSDQYKTNKLLSNMVFEYVGREKEGKTPVTLRFFVDADTYGAIPQAGFKDPLAVNDARLPETLRQDIKTYMNVRAEKAGEVYAAGSAKLSKLTLSVYAAKKFAVVKEGRGWYIVGDAAMGVPYFRALNAGLIMGSQLAGIVTRKYAAPAVKAAAFNLVRPLDKAWEFTGAHGKNMALRVYDAFRGASAGVPWEMVKWDEAAVQRFKSAPHPAFETMPNTAAKPAVPKPPAA